MKELVVNEKNSGGRLDKIVFRYLDKASSGFVYKMLRKKNITLNDKKATGAEIVQAGDSIKLFLSDETIARFKSGLSVKDAKKAGAVPAVKSAPGKSVSLKSAIVFEDENIIAINKPAGLLSQKAAPSDLSVNDFLVSYIKGDEFFAPGVCNRLDRNTSGLILAGKNLAAQRELSRAIAGRDIAKKYMTVVMGRLENPEKLDGFLVKDEENNIVRIVSEGGDRIITSYIPLASGDGVSLLEVDLVTGKSHQIRAHLASIGHPVAGDTKYGSAEMNAVLLEKYNLKHQLLHAAKIEFINMEGILGYLNGKTIEAVPPTLFKKVLEGEGLWQPGVQGD